MNLEACSFRSLSCNTARSMQRRTSLLMMELNGRIEKIINNGILSFLLLQCLKIILCNYKLQKQAITCLPNQNNLCFSRTVRKGRTCPFICRLVNNGNLYHKMKNSIKWTSSITQASCKYEHETLNPRSLQGIRRNHTLEGGERMYKSRRIENNQ